MLHAGGGPGGLRGCEDNPSPNPSPKRRGESEGRSGPPLRTGEGLGEGLSSHPLTCDGVRRRDFLHVGALGLGDLFLPDLLRARDVAAAEGRRTRNTSVVWLWLGGGPTHIETFDPKMSAPSAFRSTIGAAPSVVPGVHLGGLFPKMAQVADRMAFVRSFGHDNTNHEAASHLVMTGHALPSADEGQAPIQPSLGAILARQRGPTSATGLPTYVRLSGILGDGAAGLGEGFAPFDGGGSTGLDRNRAFDLRREAPGVRDRYGPGLGEQLLLARRLCEAGVGFVTIHFGGWDMHGAVAEGLRLLAPQVDHAVAAFVRDTVERGLDRDILLVISGEFGRTPRLNAHGGRDHWPTLVPLALVGGGLRMGQVVGASSDRAETPRTTPLGPRDLMATVLHVLGIPPTWPLRDQEGRPLPLRANGKPIAELI
jgi:hypothetical protein